MPWHIRSLRVPARRRMTWETRTNESGEAGSSELSVVPRKFSATSSGRLGRAVQEGPLRDTGGSKPARFTSPE